MKKGDIVTYKLTGDSCTVIECNDWLIEVELDSGSRILAHMSYFSF